MANTVEAGKEELWSKRMQVVMHKKPVFQALASTEEQETLKTGDTVHRPYRSRFVVNDLGAEGSYSRQDVTDTDESLVINHEKEVSFYVKDLDVIQNKYGHLTKTGIGYADDSAKDLFNKIDADFLNDMSAQADGAVSAATLSTSNVVATVTGAYQKVLEQTNDMNPAGLFAALSPQFYNILIQAVGARATQMGDGTTKNGRVGEYFGFDLYLTNNLRWSASLAMATNPTADDTVSIAGVTFTFKAAPSAAGEVDIGANVDATRVLLAKAINNTNGYAAGAGSATAYFEVSAADRKLLEGVTATDVAASDVMTVEAVGKSYCDTAETFTAGGDEWTAASSKQHNVFGIKKATDLVIQKRPNTEMFHRDGYVGHDIVSWTAYGIKTFDEGDAKLVNVPILSGAF